MFNREDYEKRISWFTEARFGMFIHWGLYAIPARGEWVRNAERISVEDYQIFFDTFDPKDCDPVSWAKLAKKAGMKYAILTAKHHDGFCLFDSKLSNYTSMYTPANRDFVREFTDAFRAEGLKVGLYYSLLDWHHPDYPHYGDRIHPLRDSDAEKEMEASRGFSRYIEYFHGQVRELCTNYGKIDLMWFDFSYDDMTGEKWKATELVRMIRSLQPGILIDNRLEVSGEGFGSLLTGNPSDYSGDFVSPEQIIPPTGIFDTNGNRVVWEACMTMNNSWGYTENDHFFKPARMIIRKLVECVSKGGNLLLNVGPDANGRIPCESVEILDSVGSWMSRNSDSIYFCGFGGIDKPDYGRITRNGDKLYYHVFDNPVGGVPLTGLNEDQIRQVRLLRSNVELLIEKSWITGNYPDVFVSLGENPIPPDETDTVIEVTLH